LFTDCLNKYGEFKGPGADHFLPRTHGLLGIAYFHAGDLVKAREHTQAAAASTADGDALLLVRCHLMTRTHDS
jgi:hypothetical protein